MLPYTCLCIVLMGDLHCGSSADPQLPQERSVLLSEAPSPDVYHLWDKSPRCQLLMMLADYSMVWMYFCISQCWSMFSHCALLNISVRQSRLGRGGTSGVSRKWNRMPKQEMDTSWSHGWYSFCTEMIKMMLSIGEYAILSSIWHAECKWKSEGCETNFEEAIDLCYVLS